MKEAGVDGDAQRADERNRSRRGREGLNFNPRVTEFTDICTRIRLAVAHSFSETTLSLLSIPKTYSSSYICRWMRPFSLEGRERKKKTPRKANWIACVEFEWCRHDNLQPCMSSRILSYIVCILMEELTRGGRKKMTCDKRFIWAVNMSSSPIQTSCQPLVFPLWWRWPRS